MPTYEVSVPTRRPEFQRKAAILRGDVEAPASVAVIILSDHFGSFDWFNWEPDVLYQEVLDDFRVRMPQSVRDKIWALVTALTTDLFYNDAVVFNHIANALGDGPTNMTDFEPATPEELAWSVIEVGINDSDTGDDLVFSPEVRAYVGRVLEEHDLGPVPPLEWADAKTPPLPTDDPVIAKLTMDDRTQKIADIQHYTNERLMQLKTELAKCGFTKALPQQQPKQPVRPFDAD